jgi:hypothetical protein
MSRPNYLQWGTLILMGATLAILFMSPYKKEEWTKPESIEAPVIIKTKLSTSATMDVDEPDSCKCQKCVDEDDDERKSHKDELE